MGVGMDPGAFDRGATTMTGHADALGGHATTVAELAALRSAFGTIGAPAFEAVAARLAEITGGLEAARERTTRVGEVLGAAARDVTAIDVDRGRGIQEAGAPFAGADAVGR